MGETRAKMARGSARSRRSFPGTLPQCNFEWVQHPTARGQGRCRVDWYPIRAVERDRHRRQWHMRQWKSQAVAVAQASKTADEVGVDARVEAHLLPPNIRCARSTGPATPGSEAACTSTTPRERRGGMSKTHSGATRQGTTCSRVTDDSRTRRNATGGVDERPVAAAAALGRLVRRGRRPLRERQRRWQRRKRQWHTSHAKQDQDGGTDTARPRRQGQDGRAKTAGPRRRGQDGKAERQGDGDGVG